MGKLILITVGTSVFDNKKIENGFNNSDVSELNRLVEEDDTVPDIENQISEVMSTASFIERQANLTAEMASLVAFDKKHPIKDSDWIILLHSEDKKSEVCAHINAMAIVKRFFNNSVGLPISPVQDEQINELKDYITTDTGGVGIIKIERLSPESNQQEFLNALINLEERINSIRDNFPNWTAYFNVTGGLKGVIPLTTVLSIQRGMYIFYMHEDSEGIFRIDYQDLKKRINKGESIAPTIGAL